MFFAAKDREALDSQQKQDWKLYRVKKNLILFYISALLEIRLEL